MFKTDPRQTQRPVFVAAAEAPVAEALAEASVAAAPVLAAPVLAAPVLAAVYPLQYTDTQEQHRRR